MKTKWGSCNAVKSIVWLNAELAHLVSPNHDHRFVQVLDREFPRWRDTRRELNELRLAAWST